MSELPSESSPPPSQTTPARVDEEGYSDDCSGHPLPPMPSSAGRKPPRPVGDAAGSGRSRLLVIGVPTAIVLVGASVVSWRYLQPAGATPASTVTTPAPVLTEAKVREAAGLLELKTIKFHADVPTAVVSEQTVETGSTIHVFPGDTGAAVDFRVLEITPDSVRLIAEIIDPPVEVVLRVGKREAE